MKIPNMKPLSKVTEKIIIFTASVILFYILISLYFTNHYLFHTVINGAEVSLKKHGDTRKIIIGYINNYEIHFIDRNGKTEEISAQDIGMRSNGNADFNSVTVKQKPYQWISSIFRSRKYHINGLYSYDEGKLTKAVSQLNYFTRKITEPQNVKFRYSNGTYQMIQEVRGNKVRKDKLYEAVKTAVSEGKPELNIVEEQCYEEPKYNLTSEEALTARNLLNKYVSSKVTYLFRNRKEILDGNLINEWLNVDDNLHVKISIDAVAEYVNSLGLKYNTVGAARNFKTSSGNIVEVKGGLYGWKINQVAETKALLEIITQGEAVEREPEYLQRALSRDENDIGDTYIEISITKQHLWFYKDGNLIAHGSVVTGNPNKGNPTVLGTYKIMYKEKGSTLSGFNYDVRVAYWMPFYGNFGIHDASWRYAFGGEIYKRKGTHGCVNVPLYLAKMIFDNVEKGTPVICYNE